MTTVNPKFLITRFTHGAGGKFLSSVLQTSSHVDHWNYYLERCKSRPWLFNKLNVFYTKKSWPSDSIFRMRREPIAPYNTDLYSSSYPRGSNITVDEFMQHANDVSDIALLSAARANKKINLIMHKPMLPTFCVNSQVVTILTESNDEINWVHHTLWRKHFLEINNEILHLSDHPKYCSLKSLKSVLAFKNPCVYSRKDKQQVIHDLVVNDVTCYAYKDRNNFPSFDDSSIDNFFIPLSSFFNFSEFFVYVQRIFDQFDLGTPNRPLIEAMHQIWLSRQIQFRGLSPIMDVY